MIGAVSMLCPVFTSGGEETFEAGRGGNGGSRDSVAAGGSVVSAVDGTGGACATGLSVGTLSFDDLVIIVGFAAGLSSEYSGPPMLSSTTSFDSPVLDSPALAFAFTTGVGCLPGFCCSTLAFFAGTA